MYSCSFHLDCIHLMKRHTHIHPIKSCVNPLCIYFLFHLGSWFLRGLVVPRQRSFLFHHIIKYIWNNKISRWNYYCKQYKLILVNRKILPYQAFPLHAPWRVDVHLLILCVPSLHQVVGNFHSLGKETYLTVQQVFEMVGYVWSRLWSYPI